MLDDYGETNLTSDEAARLDECEHIIRRGLATFVDVGTALLEIRDNRLYRAQYETFEDYCADHWNMSARRANQLVSASEVVFNIQSMGTMVPTNERVARELRGLSPDDQREVWQAAVESAPEGRVTAAHVRETAAAYRADAEDEAPARSNGVPAALQMSVSNEWYTPARYIEAARRVLGSIDLDPASNPFANRTVKATNFYTQEDDGLQFNWHGNVWMNCPYGRDGGESNQGIWSARLIEQYRTGFVTAAVMLVNAVTDRTWFAPLWDFPICFTDHRIRFYDEDGEAGSPTHGNALVYLGEHKQLFAEEFHQFGPVVMQVVRDASDFIF